MATQVTLNSGSVDSAGSLALKTNGTTTAVTIDTSQNVGIGTSSPTQKLDVNGNIRTTGEIATSAADFVYSWAGGTTGQRRSGFYLDGSNQVLRFYTAQAEVGRFDSSGNLLVGKTVTSVGTVGNAILPSGRVQISNSATTSADDGIQIYSTGASAYRFFVGMGGQINATNTSITAISDVSLKENIRDLETGLSEVLQLKPRRFDWKEETQLEQKNIAGFIAQELEEVLPDLVYEYKYSDTETKKSIKMGDILPTLVKAIQEQQALITTLTDRITALESK